MGILLPVLKAHADRVVYETKELSRQHIDAIRLKTKELRDILAENLCLALLTEPRRVPALCNHADELVVGMRKIGRESNNVIPNGTDD